MNHSFHLCAAVLAAALAAPAGAQQTGPPAEPALAPSAGAIIVPPSVTAPAPTGWSAQQVAAAFLGADTNRDGNLTRAEAQTITAVRLNFEELDANKDGMLSRSEFENGVR
jgi:hypothetical protein